MIIQAMSDHFKKIKNTNQADYRLTLFSKLKAFVYEKNLHPFAK